jgi:hypothetical protein
VLIGNVVVVEITDEKIISVNEIKIMDFK